MDTLVTVVFLACAGIALFIGLNRDTIQDGKVPEPIAAYWSG